MKSCLLSPAASFRSNCPRAANDLRLPPAVLAPRKGISYRVPSDRLLASRCTSICLVHYLRNRDGYAALVIVVPGIRADQCS
jgi:hypothetical protein